MYKRLELHNHTTESDGALTPSQLIQFMEEDLVDGFAITDHNTISGHRKIKELLEQKKSRIAAIYGMEYTTYYGHILCLNLKEYLSWESIDLHRPELLFHRLKEKGALVGIAHPYSYGHPFARGCRFDMTITDFTSFDFLEIFNNPEPLHQVNEPALLWWEDLVLKGYSLAVTCGMDLHGSWDMKDQYATFIEGVNGGDVEKELEHAIHHQKTWVSRGPILEVQYNSKEQTILFTICDTKKPGFSHTGNDPYILTVRSTAKTCVKEFSDCRSLVIPYNELYPDSDPESILIPKLYQTNTEIENLVAVAPVILPHR
ncbi:CehA/McbA family metallohydrolase [Clostridium boliviensis]|uniref:CehA/McbA family metallohydrolase n=1 Tax=Clostridium boliviensis TaxID=318465 RepID=A0ABU4GND1_9CLOT|nr:CehA/McbA family metallohydrolase [Clostridium boliviensis]MDW2799127.1 CehA/McbA family metallohydrolase [Clostridium boliviensis]